MVPKRPMDDATNKARPASCRLAVSLLLLCAIVPAAFAVDISASHESAGLGETVVVPITIGDPVGQGIVGISLTVTYDPSLLSVIVDNQGFTVSASFGADAPADWFLEQNEIAPGQLELAMAADFDTPLDTPGELLTIAFVATDTLATASAVSPVALTAQFNEGAVPATSTDGSVTIAMDVSAISDVLVSNHSNGSARITWWTDAPASSEVSYGLSPGDLSMSATGDASAVIHVVELSGLTADTDYYFSVRSGIVEAATDDAGNPYTFHTTLTGVGGLFTLVGRVVDSSGAPLAGALLWLTVANPDTPTDLSFPLSSVTDANGTWFVDLVNLKNVATLGPQLTSVGDLVSTQCLAVGPTVGGVIEQLRGGGTQTLLQTSGTQQLDDCVAGVECVTLILKAGNNMISFPLRDVLRADGSVFTARTFLESDIVYAEKVYGLIPGGVFQVAAVHPVLGFFGDEFNIDETSGYIVQVAQDTTLEVCGRAYSSAPTYELQAGNNGIGIPYPPNVYTSRTLLEAIPGAEKVYGVIPGGVFQVGAVHPVLGYFGDEFDILPDRGYILQMAQAYSFTPSDPGMPAPSRARIWDDALAHVDTHPRVSDLLPHVAVVSWLGPAHTVRVGLTPDRLDRAVRDIGSSHRVVLDGLMPDTTYHYSVDAYAGTFTTPAKHQDEFAFHSLAGRLLESDGRPAADGALVYVRVRDRLLSAQAVGGVWAVDLVNAVDGWELGDPVEVTAYATDGHTARTFRVQAGDTQVLPEITVQAGPDPALGRKTALYANFPNPFNPETWIPFELGDHSQATLAIFDSRGRVVRRMDLGLLPPGRYQSRERAIYWDGRNGLGERLASGVYYYVLSTDDHRSTRRMVLLR